MAPRRTFLRTIACHHCGTLHRIGSLPEGASARCTVCGTTLFRARRASIERTLAWTLASLVLFGVAHAFPFMSLEIEGRARTATLLSGPVQLWRDGMWPLALAVLAAATLFPLLKLLAQLATLLPLQLGRRPPWVGRIFRLVEALHPWAMTEVYLLGVVVAYVKLSDFATVELDIALFAFVALILAMLAADTALEPHEVWERLRPQTPERVLQPVPGTELVSCHACDQLLRLPRHGPAAACPRCGAELHRRIPRSLQRTWALVAAAAILYLPANMLPILTVVYFGAGEPDTILSGVLELFAAGMWPVALLVFFASIVVPVLKLAGLAFLLLSVQLGWTQRRRDRTVLYRLIEGIGRWSMVDVFMIALLVALVNLGAIATIMPGAGAICFTAVVVLTMIASMSFDSRLIWDAGERHDAGPEPARA
jgi:paraquat-inducible protein A